MSKSIGVFDSGYGGLTILSELRKFLPSYDFIYLGDNARSPYGTRSFDVVYQYTLEAVKQLFDLDCELVILACNTASAKALRNIQRNYLPSLGSNKRVLGVIRPSVEAISSYTNTRHIGLFATLGTVRSLSYPLEIKKLYTDIVVKQEACPMWVPLIENNEYLSEGADYFIKQHVSRLLENDYKIDAIILACTHYPLLKDKIMEFLPREIKLIPQGEIVAKSLIDYLKRHTEMNICLSKNSKCEFYTSETVANFEKIASFFLKEKIKAKHIVF